VVYIEKESLKLKHLVVHKLIHTCKEIDMKKVNLFFKSQKLSNADELNVQQITLKATTEQVYCHIVCFVVISSYMFLPPMESSSGPSVLE
jgi:hypothetical protein